jgi:hypothetical protein
MIQNDVVFLLCNICKYLCSMAWSCSVCEAGEPAEVSYASVLVFGTQDMQQVQEHEREVCSASPVANATSYCVRCRRVTATFDAQLSTAANLILTHKRRLEYTQHKLFQESLPGKVHFRKLLRKTSRKHGCSIKPRL